jgi:integrase
MAKVNIRVRPETETLYLDFFFRGARCREQTALMDTPEHRKRLQALANRIQKEIERGTFDYGAFFPNSPKAEVFANGGPARPGPAAEDVPAPPPAPAAVSERQTPTFADFAELWFLEMSPSGAACTGRVSGTCSTRTCCRPLAPARCTPSPRPT